MTRRSNRGRLRGPSPGPRRDAQRRGADRGGLRAAQDEGRAALMPYMMAGFPDRESSLAVAAAYADAGADLIELGVPFSDPLADGPTIHAAATAALGGRGDAGDGAGGLRVGRRPGPGGADGLREHGPRPRRAPRSSPAGAAAAGAAGAIVPDLPLGEAEDDPRGASPPPGLALVPLVAPTTLGRAAGADLRRGAGASSTSSRPSGRPASATSCRPASPSWSRRRRPMPRSRSRSASGSAPRSRPRRSARSPTA